MKESFKTIAYRSGQFYRRTNKGKKNNPYRIDQGVQYLLWLAGWNDKDIEINSTKQLETTSVNRTEV